MLHRIDQLSSLPGAALAVGSGLLVGVALGACLHFSTDWETGFEVTTSAITLMMVFVIQHTQGREQSATQRKLDELLRALPDAEPRLIMLEEAPEAELRQVEDVQREIRDGVQNESRR